MLAIKNRKNPDLAEKKRPALQVFYTVRHRHVKASERSYSISHCSGIDGGLPIAGPGFESRVGDSNFHYRPAGVGNENFKFTVSYAESCKCSEAMLIN